MNQTNEFTGISDFFLIEINHKKCLPFPIFVEQITVGYKYEEYNKIQNNAVQVRRSLKVTICIR